MRFSSISINLLKIFRTISFVFDLKYLSQNSINFNMLGVFWNLQDEQISKLSLNLYLEQHLKEISRFFTAAGAVCHHCIYIMYRCMIIMGIDGREERGLQHLLYMVYLHGKNEWNGRLKFLLVMQIGPPADWANWELLISE